MSQWASGLKFADFSQDAIYQARRFPLDSVGCALGGYQQHDVAIALEGLTEVGGSGWATLIGAGKQVDSVTASPANALMIRCMDYNDIYGKQDPFASIGHLSGRDGPCERRGSDGHEVIVGLVLGHEFEMRLCEAALASIRERGLAPRYACRFRFPDCCSAYVAPRPEEDAACKSESAPCARHFRSRHRSQAHHDEEHRLVVTIHTSDGRQLNKQLDYPKRDPRNPLTDQKVEEKFEA